MRLKALDMMLLGLEIRKSLVQSKFTGYINLDLLHSNISENLEPRRRVLNFMLCRYHANEVTGISESPLKPTPLLIYVTAWFAPQKYPNSYCQNVKNFHRLWLRPTRALNWRTSRDRSRTGVIDVVLYLPVFMMTSTFELNKQLLSQHPSHPLQSAEYHQNVYRSRNNRQWYLCSGRTSSEHRNSRSTFKTNSIWSPQYKQPHNSPLKPFTLGPSNPHKLWTSKSTSIPMMLVLVTHIMIYCSGKTFIPS